MCRASIACSYIDCAPEIQRTKGGALPQPSLTHTQTRHTQLQGEHYLQIDVTVLPESASVSEAGGLPQKAITTSRKVFFDLVDPADAMDPIGPPAVR